MGEAAVELGPRWEPQPGPQDMFAKSPAEIVVFGGSAGGGKSFALLYEAGKWVLKPEVRGYRAVIFRRTNPEITGGGGLWDESQAMYSAFGGTPRQLPHLAWWFEHASGKRGDRHKIEFRHLEYESDRFKHQGRQYAFIGFDELTHFEESQFWYLYGRARSMSGVKPYVRATCNPDPDSFVAKLVAWWIGDDGYPVPERAGVIRWFVRVGGDALEWFDTRAEAVAAHPESDPTSFTFIPSRLKDNKILTATDPGYRAKLMSMARTDRERLLGDEDRGGNWNEQGEGGLYFARKHIREADAPPSRIVAKVRFWDKAATKPNPKNPRPDWTRGALVCACENGEIWVDDVVSAQESPGAVFNLMRSTAEEDGTSTIVGWWIDSGGAGKTDHETTEAVMVGYRTETVDSRTSPANEDRSRARSSPAKRAWAKTWVKFVSGPSGDGSGGRFYVRRGAPWTEDLKRELDRFPDAPFDDIFDAVTGGVQVLLRMNPWAKAPPPRERTESPAVRAGRYV